MTVDVGDVAPEFVLNDTQRTAVRLSTFRGDKNVVLVFLPGAFTRTCTGELCALRDNLSEFQNEGAQLLAVTADSVPSQRSWAAEQGFTFPLLSDFWPHGAIAEMYGVFNPETGQAKRATFIIDRDGIVRWKVINGDRDPRNPADYERVLHELDAAPESAGQGR